MGIHALFACANTVKMAFGGFHMLKNTLTARLFFKVTLPIVEMMTILYTLTGCDGELSLDVPLVDDLICVVHLEVQDWLVVEHVQ